MRKVEMELLLQQMSSLRAGVIGDVCLDAYWEADVTRSVLSRETPHHNLPIVDERYSPGAAGNVAANLVSLGCREVYVCSVIGKDWRGMLLKEQFANRGINDSFLLTVDKNWSTPAYFKSVRVGLQKFKQEDARLDFQNFHPLPHTIVAELINNLDSMMEQCDIIAVTDQLPYGVIGDEIRLRLATWADRGKIIVVDSREQIGKFRNVIIKPNEIEATSWLEPHADRKQTRSMEQWGEMSKRLSQEVNGVCCMTLGSEGAVWAEAGKYIFVPGQTVEPPIDIVGAGDSFAAALLCALGVGSERAEAMAFAHLAASVVVRKIGTTGTASPYELLEALGREHNGIIQQQRRT